MRWDIKDECTCEKEECVFCDTGECVHCDTCDIGQQMVEIEDLIWREYEREDDYQ